MSLPELLETMQPGASLLESPSAAWTENLLAAAAELEELNRETEKDFLTVGSRAASLIEIAGKISTELASLAEAGSADYGQQAAGALGAMLGHASEMRAGGEQGARLLEGMRQAGGKLKAALSRFSNTIANFHSLWLLTRIETARLGSSGADFGSLSEEVRLLAQRIQSGVEISLGLATDLIPRIEGALRQVSELQDTQAKSLPLMMEQATDSLASIRDIQKEAQQASLRLGAEYGEISEAFKQWIVSMQFNDITRQQVEHVIDVLRRLTSETTEDGTPLLTSAGLAGVLRLQCSQLANADETFRESIAGVDKSLDEISSRVAKMVREGGGLSGYSGGSSTLQQMERGCNAILLGLRESARADESASETGKDLAKKIDRMRASIEAIRTIEIQMRRMAMNARIGAEHLGKSGEALGALADSMKQQAADSRQGSDSVLEALHSLNDALGLFSEHARTSSSRARADEEQDAEQIRTALAELHACQENSAKHTGQVAVDAKRLSSGIQEARSGLRAGVRFTRVVKQSLDRLKRIASEAELAGYGGDSEAAALILARFDQHYSMESERNIAVRITSGASNRETPPNGDSNSSASDVEFF